MVFVGKFYYGTEHVVWLWYDVVLHCCEWVLNFLQQDRIVKTACGTNGNWSNCIRVWQVVVIAVWLYFLNDTLTIWLIIYCYTVGHMDADGGRRGRGGAGVGVCFVQRVEQLL